MMMRGIMTRKAGQKGISAGTVQIEVREEEEEKKRNKTKC